MADVLGLVKAGLKARNAFRNWRQRVRARKGIEETSELIELDHTEGDIMDTLIWQFVEKGLRHAVGYIGGAATAAGLVTENDVQALVGGVVAIAAFGWSFGRAWWRKRKGLSVSGMTPQKNPAQ